MKDEYIQYKAAEDDCVYLYNVDIKKWQKLCDIETPAHLPLSVIKKVRDDKKKAQSLPAAIDRTSGRVQAAVGLVRQIREEIKALEACLSD